MYYNTLKFGNELRHLRQNMELTQKDIFELTGINENTQRKIENGKVLPKQETLDLLSMALKRDISQLFLSCRMDMSGHYETLLNQIEDAFENSDMEKLADCKAEAVKLLASNMNPYYKQLMKQLLFLMEGCIASFSEEAYEAASEKFLAAITMTIPNFLLQNFENYFYSKIELQILMNLGLNQNELHHFDSALRILKHCTAIIESDEEFSTGYLTAKVYYNTSYLHHLSNLNEEALFYAKAGIAYNINNRSHYAMGALHIRKGFAEYNLGLESYKKSFRTGLMLFELSGQHKLYAMTLNILTEKHGISLI